MQLSLHLYYGMNPFFLLLLYVKACLTYIWIITIVITTFVWKLNLTNKWAWKWHPLNEHLHFGRYIQNRSRHFFYNINEVNAPSCPCKIPTSGNLLQDKHEGCLNLGGLPPDCCPTCTKLQGFLGKVSKTLTTLTQKDICCLWPWSPMSGSSHIQGKHPSWTSRSAVSSFQLGRRSSLIQTPE